VPCFDTAFHRTLPRVAKLLPIPRRFDAKGVQRYDFLGLSSAYLMKELARLGDPAATKGRVILAHPGNGASLAAGTVFDRHASSPVGLNPIDNDRAKRLASLHDDK
jgi:acetate kinase